MDPTNNVFQRFKDSDFYYHFKRDKVAIVSFIIFFILVILAGFSTFIAPFDPYDFQIEAVLDIPSRLRSLEAISSFTLSNSLYSTP